MSCRTGCKVAGHRWRYPVCATRHKQRWIFAQWSVSPHSSLTQVGLQAIPVRDNLKTYFPAVSQIWGLLELVSTMPRRKYSAGLCWPLLAKTTRFQVVYCKNSVFLFCSVLVFPMGSARDSGYKQNLFLKAPRWQTHTVGSPLPVFPYWTVSTHFTLYCIVLTRITYNCFLWTNMDRGPRIVNSATLV